MDGQMHTGLTNQALLDKIDKLRELNVKSLQLPQLVVVGDQSSGKSSILESLTGFSFPQAPGLCTRYATQISCRRDSEQSVSISIIPRPGADAALEDRLRSFQWTIDTLSNEELVEVIEEANQVMGIKMRGDETDSNLTAFSEDILKIEINGRTQEHFTVIDVPGISRNASPPLTSDSDVALVRRMVQSYMENSRTIILAVLPSNVDISTQEILTMAQTADPTGQRTMGVLTKPDLVMEDVNRKTIQDLVLGRRHKLRLGYYVVKNRSADDQNSTLYERLEHEKLFFAERRWSQLSSTNRCGIPSLRARLSYLLMMLTKKEIPNVMSDAKADLETCRAKLNDLGPARNDHGSQRTHIGRIATKFQMLTQAALNGFYDSDPVFTADPSFKLITTITKLNEKFANDFWMRGHKRHISAEWNDEGDKAYEVPDMDAVSAVDQAHGEYPKLFDITELEDYTCPKAIAFKDDSIMKHIERVYQENRGPELGTFSGAILSVVFREQSEKWKPLALAHVSKAISQVHNYIMRLLSHICSEEHINTRIWEDLIKDEVHKAYARAIEHTRFLLHIECDGRPSTFNHYFNSEVQKKRLDRINATISNQEVTPYKNHGPYISTANLRSLVVDKDNMQQVCEDILDVLTSYYKVARKRFVNALCRQVISHFLLDGDQSPLRVFSPDLVMGLDDKLLEKIAGEDAERKDRRAILQADMANLEAAMQVLRS